MLGFKKRKRRRIFDSPFPQPWRTLIDRNVPYARLLDREERAGLEGRIQVFLHEKRFEGCAGLEITDEIRVTIAAQACILLLNRETDYFPGMKTIFVYPERFSIHDMYEMPDGTVLEEDDEFDGESWMRGPVVLAWDEVLESAADPGDGYNVVFHEFAHQLDNESGEDDGAPVLESTSMYPAWEKVMRREYERLGTDIERGSPHVIDDYGAESPTEFFAVATEAFFEKPLAVRRRHPELYEQMCIYYKQDPAARFERAASSGRRSTQ